MNRNLMTQALKKLEFFYPNKISSENFLRIMGLKSSDKELGKIIEYLEETKKIYIDKSKSGVFSQIKRNYMVPGDMVKITTPGIDFLNKLDEISVEKNKGNAITRATIVLALVGFIQAIVYFEEFSRGIRDGYDWLALLLIGITLFAIVVIMTSPFILNSVNEISKLKHFKPYPNQ